MSTLESVLIRLRKCCGETKEEVISTKTLHYIAFTLLIIGGLNWGLVGLFNYNLVSGILGSWPMLVQIVYILVGVSAAYIGATHMTDCKACKMK